MSVPTLIQGTKEISDAKEKGKILNEYFCSQCRVDDRGVSAPNEVRWFQNNVVLSTVQTSDREVFDCFKSVDVSKASGPDCIQWK